MSLQNLITRVRDEVGQHLRTRSIRRDRSRYGWKTAPAYTKYLREAQRAFALRDGGKDKFQKESEYFDSHQFVGAVTDGSSTILRALANRIATGKAISADISAPAPFKGPGWGGYPEIDLLFRGDLGDLIRAAFRSEFKIAHGGFILKKGGQDGPKIWHSDSGPGTCLNVFAYLSDGYPENGPTALLPWEQSKELFSEETRWLREYVWAHPEARADKRMRREALAEFYRTEIERRFPDKVTSPSGSVGLMVLFNNNTLHAAQGPGPGHDRLVAAFRVYPAITPPDFTRLAQTGIPGKMNYPDARAEF